MTGQIEQGRFVDLDGRTACVRLEGEFWDCLDELQRNAMLLWAGC